jgi:hypothetical protein
MINAVIKFAHVLQVWICSPNRTFYAFIRVIIQGGMRRSQVNAAAIRCTESDFIQSSNLFKMPRRRSMLTAIHRLTEWHDHRATSRHAPNDLGLGAATSLQRVPAGGPTSGSWPHRASPSRCPPACYGRCLDSDSSCQSECRTVTGWRRYWQSAGRRTTGSARLPGKARPEPSK